MKPEDVPETWVAEVNAAYYSWFGFEQSSVELRVALAAVAPLIAAAEREKCLTAVYTQLPLGPTIDRAATLAAIRARGDAT